MWNIQLSTVVSVCNIFRSGLFSVFISIQFSATVKLQYIQELLKICPYLQSRCLPQAGIFIGLLSAYSRLIQLIASGKNPLS